MPTESVTLAPAHTLAVLQPGYLPWLGFFDQVRRSDLFMYYDDVQFDKHGWRNRNRIKSPQGPHWLTVPIRHTGAEFPSILDAEIDRRIPWARKHVATVQHFYARAPYLRPYLPQLEEVLNQPWERLVDLDLAVCQLFFDWLGIKTRVARASELDVGGTRSERLLNLCRLVGARRYLSGDAAQAYLDLDLFAGDGIEVCWQRYEHPIYAQLHGPFVSHLSALDLILNCGADSAAILSNSSAKGVEA
jgi:hypothetical protein